MKNLLIMAVLALSFSVSNASAEDFKGLIYRTLNKGKIGEEQFKWYKENLINFYGFYIKPQHKGGFHQYLNLLV